MSKLLLCLLLWSGSWALFLALPSFDLPALWLVISGFIALALAMLLLYWEHRQKQRQTLRIMEVEAAALRAQMNPHFIFNSLNAIQHLILQEDKHNASRFLTRFAKLVRSTLHRSTQSAISLEEEIEALEQYLQLEQLRFQNSFSYSIHIDPQIDCFDTQIPPLLIQPFVENAILHGLAKKQELGKIDIHFKASAQGLQISIQDNGIGFRQSQLLKRNTSTKHQSLGWQITNNRLALYNGKSDNQIDVKELMGADGRIAGTLVRLCVMI